MLNRLRVGPKTFGLLVMLSLAATLAYSLEGRFRSVYLPGPTTDGHYQIESECKSCHTGAFSDREDLQAACVRCHGEELTASNDSHPKKKFTDPRNADRVKELDARYCVTCHREHRPEATSQMGLTLPVDYCYRCHRDVGEERPSHRGLPFDGCASAGCHNFHDNRALYEDFLAKHLAEPELTAASRNPKRAPVGATREKRLDPARADAPAGFVLASTEVAAWAGSAHAAGGVNCSACHRQGDGSFTARVDDGVCAECHDAERRGFQLGRHGMRAGAGLPPLRVGEARAPMQTSAGERTLGCTSCHGAHRFDTRFAAVDACLGCHDDGHSRAYRGSPHERSWLADTSGESGASCATCHLPRHPAPVAAGSGRVEHNQSDNLRPNEKMLKGVCLNCHGLGFSIDALADSVLIGDNFEGRPRRHVGSLDMVEKRLSR